MVKLRDWLAHIMLALALVAMVLLITSLQRAHYELARARDRQQRDADARFEKRCQARGGQNLYVTTGAAFRYCIKPGSLLEHETR